MAELLPGQIEVNGLLLGVETEYVISAFTPGGKPESETNDRVRPNTDGRIFGRDRLNGRNIALELTVDCPDLASASTAYSALARVWNDAATRRTSSEVVPMRVRMFDGVGTKTVYGRPRRFESVNEHFLDRGRVDVVADFACVDHLWYEEQPDPMTVSINVPSTGAFTAPFTVPVISSTTSSGVGEFATAGTEDTWLRARIHGPIAGPIIDVLGLYQVHLTTILLDDQYVDIDARPWVRTVLRNDGANLAGTFTADTPPMSQMVLPPGAHEVVLRGVDMTSTAQLTVWWQGAATHPFW